MDFRELAEESKPSQSLIPRGNNIDMSLVVEASMITMLIARAAASLSLGTVRQKLVGVPSSDVEVGLSGKGEAL
jgi:hypothetical protein